MTGSVLCLARKLRWIVCAVALAATAQVASANGAAPEPRVIRGEYYIPGIWVDPDGCEHWVLDDGIEGYMSPHVNRHGLPVCRNQPRATNDQIAPRDPVTGARRGERYVPGIWVDPDGCEHWVLDDGAEGYMSPHVRRNGLPVCRP